LSLASRRNFGASAPVKKIEKDYYSILGISSTATQEMIKDAYRTMAKKHHPDVRMAEEAGVHEPDVEKFRDVVEAYQVLSVKESRAAFDLSRKRNAYQSQQAVDLQEEMNQRRDLRNKAGNLDKTPAVRGSYAEQRLAELKKEREKYNVNDLGYYNGGVPRKHRGTMRGEALGEPGRFHSPQMHNFMHYNHADSYRVTQDDAVMFKAWMGTDQIEFMRSRPSYPMFYDKDFDFMKDRDFWLKMILGMMLTSYAYKKLRVERDRARMTARMNGYQNYPGHWFHNRGGVVVMKEFVGFTKYYKNEEDLFKWYKMVYPR
jgi:curved DNA-binding protein CbpA